MMENAKNIREQMSCFYKMIKISKVPWYLYLLTLAMDLLSSTIYVYATVTLGEIMEGKIFSRWGVTKYGILSLSQEFAFILGTVIFYWVSVKFNKALTLSIWSKTLHMKTKDLDKENPSTLISRVTRDTGYVNVAISGVFQVIHVIYSTVIIFIQMFKMNTNLSFMLLTVIVWSFITMVVVGNMSYEGQTNIQRTYSVFTSYLAERIPYMRLIKALGKEKKESLTGMQRIQQQYGADVYMVKVNAIQTFLQTAGKIFVNLIILLYGSYLVGSNQLEIGGLVTFFIFVTQGEFFTNITYVSNYYQNIKIGMGGVSKIADIINGEEENLQRKKSFTVPDEDIVFDNVSFQYKEKEVLSNLNFSIPKGKCTAIVGPSGSGKTTILRLLERFYEPNSGRITYGESGIDDYHLDEWRESIGYVYQNSPLIAGTIRENITYGLKHEVKEETLQKAIKIANAYDFIQELEDGLDTQVGELGSKLSGGQRQRIAIARALIKNPDMLLLDEATCSLDACNEYEVMQSLNEFIKGKTAVVVAHKMETVRNADNIIVLEKGKILDVGSHESLYNRNKLYRRYCELELA